jgi:hypothetical protein
MHGIILEATKFIVGITWYLSFICDEVSTIDNQRWSSIHGYVVQSWSKLPIILSFDHVVVGLNVDNLTQVLMQALMH